MGQIVVTILMQNHTFVGKCNKTLALNCSLFGDAPKVVWLQQDGCCGDMDSLKMTFQDPKDPSAIKGIFVNVGDQTWVIDAADVASVIAACNACCGASTVVDAVYGGNLPATVSPLAKTYTVTRTDDGNLMATERFMVDYSKSIIDGSLNKLSYDAVNKISVYQFNAYKDPIQQRSDSIVETPRTYDSNTPPVLAGGNVYNAAGTVDGVNYSVKGTANINDLPALLQADVNAKNFGTWSVVAGKIRLTSTTADYATINVTSVAP